MNILRTLLNVGFDDVKVRDYCHITGKYIYPVHRDLNTILD